MPFWLDVLLKGTTLLVVIFGLAAALRRSSAATRHLLWGFGLLGLLALPFLSNVLPWRLPVLPPADGATAGDLVPAGAPEAVTTPEVQAGTGDGTSSDRTKALEGAGHRWTDASAEAGTIPSIDGTRTEGGIVASLRGIGLVGVLALVWFLGAGAILARLGIGMVTLRRYAKRARPASGPVWEDAREWAENRLLLDTPIRLLVSYEVAMPLAAGVLRPVVLMPEEAERWPDERRRAVLLHELAHVKRRDVLPHLMGWVVCALWWFHPLAWIAVRRMRSESEKACDDLVLKVGTRASRYADDLLDIVIRAGTVREPAGVVPLAQRSEFEGRILAILEPDRRRRGMSAAQAGLVALAVAGLAIPLAAVGPKEPEALPEGRPTAADVEAGEENLGALEGGSEKKVHDRLKDLVMGEEDKSRASEKGTSTEEESSKDTVEKTVETEASLDSESAFASSFSSASNGQAVAALAGAIRDDDVTVRRMAAETLGKLQDPRAVEALTRALRQDPDAKVRAMAAWALGQIEDPAGVPALSAALSEDDDVTVRVRAAEALGEIESAAGVDALGAALDDPSIEVRRAAIWALGMIEDARAVPLLLPLVRNSDVEVRRHVTEALGDIESSQAVDALIEATRDSDIEVRLNAIQALGNIEDSRALPVLVAALGEEPVIVRREAIDAIGNLDLVTAPPEVIRAVRDPDREVRHGAIDALDNFEDPASVAVLLEVVRTSNERDLQYDALEALSNIGSPAAYDALIPLLQHEDPKIRQLAAQAIGNMQ